MALAILLSSLALLVSLIPRSLEVPFGRRLGRALMRISTRRNIALQNIRNCYPGRPSSEHKKLLTANYEHYGVLMLELLHMFSPIRGHYRRYVSQKTKVRGIDNFKAAQARGKGVIFVASHLANWELMVAGGAMAGVDITMVTKRLKPSWLHSKIERTRKEAGVSAVYEPRTLPVVLRALRANQGVGFVMDQYAGPPIGIKVPFFGVEVGTLAAVGTLVERTRASVVPVLSRRNEAGQIEVEILPELSFAETDVTYVTSDLALRVEQWVKANPAQWLWIHRRFKQVVWPTKIA